MISDITKVSKNAPAIEILTDPENFSTVKLGQMVPDWWGEKYMNKE